MALREVAADEPNWGVAAATFNNKVEVATYHTVTLGKNARLLSWLLYCLLLQKLLLLLMLPSKLRVARLQKTRLSLLLRLPLLLQLPLLQLPLPQPLQPMQPLPRPKQLMMLLSLKQH
jgi:hypothetical protein